MTHEQPAIEPEVAAYWRALQSIDPEVSIAWLRAIHALADQDAQAPAKRCRLLIDALQRWEKWALRLADEAIELPERAVVGVHHLDIACYPLMQLWALSLQPWIDARFGVGVRHGMVTHIKTLVSALGDQGPSSIRREAAGLLTLTPAQWRREWRAARVLASNVRDCLSDLTRPMRPSSGGNHA